MHVHILLVLFLSGELRLIKPPLSDTGGSHDGFPDGRIDPGKVKPLVRSNKKGTLTKGQGESTLLL